MVYSIRLCLFIISLISTSQTHSGEASSRYECGRHGKFEYCIDDIPGCVIGCHCHPGYYFDTETKICEPNSKLSEDFQRRLMLNPQQMYPMNTPTLTQNIPTQTTTNTLSDRVDEMSKDTDDIGEWLYNQFFKTIETQVINKTSDDKPITRRKLSDEFSPDDGLIRDGVKKNQGGRRKMESESNNKINKKKSKTRKSAKSRGKKSKSKVHGLRRKLLRITEDDSLFDSDSESESNEDSSSSSSSSESGSSDRSRQQSEKQDHGHKKVIIFNRRPRPPLPSFIFLPNMDTPFYPPIGLPPPPILPMYPMVPIPPMAPFLPFIGKEDKSTTTEKPSSNNAPDATVSTTDDVNTTNSVPPLRYNYESTNPSPLPDGSLSTDPPPLNDDPLRSNKHNKLRIHKERRMPPKFNSGELRHLRSEDSVPSFSLTPKQMEQLKLMKAFKERMKMKKQIHSHHNRDKNAPSENNNLSNNIPLISEHKLKHQSQEDVDLKLKDVNFKYLSQLIHRGNLNSTEIPPLASNHNANNIDKILNTRRIYDPEVPIIHYNEAYTTQTSSPIKDPSDQYFMNLGRQIASLIRHGETKEENKQNNIPEINGPQESINSVLNENRYAPRSYWERYVRSPLTKLKSYLTGLHLYKEDNEQNLFSLEDEVNTFAKKARPLNLQDIENLLTSVQNANFKKDHGYVFPTQSDVSFNVNLLPSRNLNIDNNYRKMYEAPVNYIPRNFESAFTIKNQPRSPISSNTNYLEQALDKQPTAKGGNFLPTMTFTPKPSNKYDTNIMTKNKSSEQESVNYGTDVTIQYYQTNNRMNTLQPTIDRGPQAEYLKFLKKNRVGTNSNSNKSGLAKYPDIVNYHKVPKKPRSTLIKYNNVNYFSDGLNNQHYLFQASYPLNMHNFKQSLSKRIDTDRPSYFHHEFHHFDYFD